MLLYLGLKGIYLFRELFVFILLGRQLGFILPVEIFKGTGILMQEGESNYDRRRKNQILS